MLGHHTEPLQGHDERQGRRRHQVAQDGRIDPPAPRTHLAGQLLLVWVRTDLDRRVGHCFHGGAFVGLTGLVKKSSRRGDG